MYTLLPWHLTHVAANDLNKLEQPLRHKVEFGERYDIVVTFYPPPQTTISSVNDIHIMPDALPPEQRTIIVEALEDAMKTSQSNVLQTLITDLGDANKGHTFYRQYWLSNKMFVKDATVQTIRSIANDSQVGNKTGERYAY